MGDPKQPRKKYDTPRHPWNKARIDAEKEIKKDYGLKNNKEIWKFNSKLKSFKEQAKKLVQLSTEQARKEEKLLLDKLIKLNLLQAGSTLNDILGLDLKKILDRRLQTQVFKHKLARTVKQARQLIIHGHIQIDGKKVTVPSYVIKRDEETKIGYAKDSQFNDKNHPERVPDETIKQKIAAKEEKIEKPKQEMIKNV